MRIAPMRLRPWMWAGLSLTSSSLNAAVRGAISSGKSSAWRGAGTGAPLALPALCGAKVDR
jgi:hypothetical protein